ncbi:MAG: 5-formyltetrahydrofolate cyclo-ligase [Nitriliruptoraceae bacterium]
MDGREVHERKAVLRGEIRALRARLDPAERRAASTRICAEVARLDAFEHADDVLLYGASDEEVDVFALAEQVLARGGRAHLPRVSGDDLEVVAFSDDTDLVRGYRGILEPRGEATDPGTLDVVVVPGIAFDRHGRRCGQGRGFYDRFLASIDATRIAVAFDVQVVDEVPATAFDASMHALVTETQVLRFAS